ncbi:VCBS repeat-containing protein OS=Streptomyces alboniger OX=132473 GN=CP975_18450 PE=4 SV=1 [Streptomyces alboniger]
MWVTYGSPSGPGKVTGITQDTGNVPGARDQRYFGYGRPRRATATGTSSGVAGENIGSYADTGTVTILYGTASGLNTASGAQSFAQNTAGVPGADEKGDMFGIDVKLDDVTGDGKADLLVGSAENAGNGAMTYLSSNGSKITTSGSRTISPSTAGVSTTGSPYFGANFAD